MKNLNRFVVYSALALVGTAISQPATAGYISHFKGQFAEASFDSLDSANCIDASVYVFAQTGKSQSPPGPGTSGAWMDLFISKYDYCAQTQLVAASFDGPISSSDFQTDQKLNSAQLTTTVTVFDYFFGTSYPVSVALTWTAAGPAGRQNNHFHYHAPGFTVNEYSSGVSRLADAAGTVSDSTTNFTPEGSIYADIDSAKSGVVEVE
jgi:hypothetical protein